MFFINMKKLYIRQMRPFHYAFKVKDIESTKRFMLICWAAMKVDRQTLG